MLNFAGSVRSDRTGVSRRQSLQAGGAGLLGLSLPGVLAAEASGSGLVPRAKNVIFLFLFGGPSQLETFDMKPEAPEKIRGPFRPIASRTPGLRLCEHLPNLAALSDRFAVVRTMSHSYNDHSGGGHYIQTGQRWPIPIGGGFNATPNDWPSIGSAFGYLHAQRSDSAPGDLPPYMVLPNSLGRLQTYSVQLKRPGEYAGWLGRAWDPVTTSIDKRDAKDNPYFRDCTDEELQFSLHGMVSPRELTLDRLNRRRSLLEQFDDQRRALEGDVRAGVYDRFRQQALELVTSEKTRTALDIRREPDALRDRYGRNLFGQSTLMARRLIEAGSRFVTVHWDAPDGYSWDSHTHSDDVKNHLIPGLDRALASLLTDLDERGLLDDTLVVCLGEMGRTPQANGSWGRNHWSTLFPAVLAGAGIRGGLLYGESDKDAAYALTQPTSPDDLAATIYLALGIDPETRIPDRQNRPVPLIEAGHPLVELFG